MRYAGSAVWAAILGVALAQIPARGADDGSSGASAYELYRKGRTEERAGHIVQAYLLYSQASGLQPENKEYYRRSQALQSRAALLAKPGLAPSDRDGELPPEPEGPVPVFSVEDEKDIKSYEPPRELKLPPGENDYDFRGNNRQLWEAAARQLKIDAVFDRDYESHLGQPSRLKLEHVTSDVLVRALSDMTGSFVIPIGERLFMIAQDTPQKRQELEQVMSITLPIPEPVKVEEAQELGRSIQQTMEIQKFAIDGVRRQLLLRDRVSKVRSAELLLTELLQPHAEVELELEFVEVSKTSSLNIGLQLPTSFGLADFGRVLGAVATASVPAGFTNFFTFGGGRSLLGIGITNGALFASASQGLSKLVLRTEVRSSDGQPATFKVGERYPIVTQGYYGQTSGTGQVYTPPPTFNFEDLGLDLKITPRVHGTDEVTLELESNFKVLGSASINNIPIVSERKYNSTVSLKQGEWAVVSGLMTAQQARTLSGLAGISRIPVLGPLTSVNTRDKSSTDLLLVIKPRLLKLPPSEAMTRSFYTGTETKPVSPL